MGKGARSSGSSLDAIGGKRGRVLRTASDAEFARLLAGAVEAAHFSVTISDLRLPDEPLTFVNGAFERVTGYPRAEAIGRNCRFLQGAETAPESVAALRRAIDARAPADVEILNYRRSGEPFWNSLHLVPLRDGQGEVVAYAGLQHDVTARRRAAAEAEAERRTLALGRLAGAVAHEMNNLLQPLLTLPDLVARDLKPGAEAAAADLALMRQTARDARDIVRQLLDFGRTPAQGPGVADLARALAGARAACRKIAPDDVAIAFRVDVPAGCAVPASECELRQLVLNLVKNALDAIAEARASDPAGAVGRRDAIELVARLEGGRAAIRVSDTGPGVPVDRRGRIFEAFYSTKPVGGGSGLGLHIVREIVRRAGGEIDLDPACGTGATFRIALPLASPASPRAAAGGEAPRPTITMPTGDAGHGDHTHH